MFSSLPSPLPLPLPPPSLSPSPSPPLPLSLAVNWLAIFYSPLFIPSWRLLTPSPPTFPWKPRYSSRNPYSPPLPSQVINYYWAFSANCIYRSCMCFEGSFDGRDESRMSNTVNYPSCETFMSLCLKNHFNTQFTDYHLSTETIESTDGETRQNG